MSDVFSPLNSAVAAPVPVAGAPRARYLVLGLIVALSVAALGAWSLVGQYNELQHNDIRVDYSWKQVINQYTRRADLVPNLVTVVKGYAAHESALFAEIAATRAGLAKLTPPSQAADRSTVAQFESAQKQLAGQVSRLIVVAERYPDLKASTLYQDLMVQLEGTENRIAYARQQYIGSVADHNFGLRRFPTNIMAERAGLKLRETAEFADTAVVIKPVVVNLK
jgi:LemA protein